MPANTATARSAAWRSASNGSRPARPPRCALTARILRKSGNASTADQATPVVVGRFAPTPSGPLHYGSIVAAVGSYLDARHAGGRWLVRIDDLDPPRIRAGAATGILNALRCLGLHWDGEVLQQSTRTPAYADALERLQSLGLLYVCSCTRREVSGRAYPGTCRLKALKDAPQRCLRLRIPGGPLPLDDMIQGPRRFDVAATTGDIIVRRADGLTAYHLAAVVDDHFQGVTHVVRGADLLDASAIQCCVQGVLGFPAPRYGHLPMAVDASGRKLSKSLGAEAALLSAEPATLLLSALKFLGQNPDRALAGAPVQEVTDWAVANWRREKVPRAPAKIPVWPDMI
ncbi:MAG: tRNA glutamyl-Q(34) synthetase GluQRS [Gammaproteobacteria bacterium]|nr:tRNA glutamyl-Q(34) synthetase GluQRS [Gammaproteobacteria bacterium]